MKKEVFILGVGNNTSVYIDLAEACGFDVIGLYHYDLSRKGEIYFGKKILGSNEELFSENNLVGKSFSVSVGDNRLRVELSEKIRSMGGKVITLIHPTASVSPYATIDEGVTIQANAVVQAGVSIEEDSVVSYLAGVTHTSKIKKGCYIATRATVGAYITVDELAFVGMGATLVSEKLKRVGKRSVVGAGSLVISDVNDTQVVAGLPAKPIL
ncbi:hypothetical protein NFC81_06520 [Salinispirillum sp. LH 10-3-1]|uniref:PglD N-terminal domain-containing protein n=1 Tax=Salinispirillum sp. LH 10-3-1 TaxID=2952525 RepID=A0AB38YJY8_9GAMM